MLDSVLAQLCSYKDVLSNVSDEQLLNYRLESINTIFSVICMLDA